MSSRPHRRTEPSWFPPRAPVWCSCVGTLGEPLALRTAVERVRSQRARSIGGCSTPTRSTRRACNSGETRRYRAMTTMVRSECVSTPLTEAVDSAACRGHDGDNEGGGAMTIDDQSSGTSGWYPDPLQQNESRYWDGSAWTDHVANQGVMSTPTPGSATYAPSAPGAAAAPAKSGPVGRAKT